MVKRVNIVRLEPDQENDNQEQHEHVSRDEQEVLEPSTRISRTLQKKLLGRQIPNDRPYLRQENRQRDPDLLAFAPDKPEAIFFETPDDIEYSCAPPLVHDEPVHPEGVGEQEERQNDKHHQVEIVNHMDRGKGVELYPFCHKRAVKEKNQECHECAHRDERSQLPYFRLVTFFGETCPVIC